MPTWWLHGGYMVVTWWLHGGYTVVAWWLHPPGSSGPGRWWSPRARPRPHRRRPSSTCTLCRREPGTPICGALWCLHGGYIVVTWWLHGGYMVVAWWLHPHLVRPYVVRLPAAAAGHDSPAHAVCANPQLGVSVRLVHLNTRDLTGDAGEIRGDAD